MEVGAGVEVGAEAGVEVGAEAGVEAGLPLPWAQRPLTLTQGTVSVRALPNPPELPGSGVV